MVRDYESAETITTRTLRALPSAFRVNESHMFYYYNKKAIPSPELRDRPQKKRSPPQKAIAP